MELEFGTLLGMFLILIGIINLVGAVYVYIQNKKFKEKCVRGKAEIKGNCQTDDSQDTNFLVKILDYDSNDLYNCNSSQKVKCSNYPVGTVIDIDYLPEGRFVEIDMVDYPPVGKYVTPYVLGVIGALLCIIGIILFF